MAKKTVAKPKRAKPTKRPIKKPVRPKAAPRPGRAGKAEGAAPVMAYIDSLTGWQKEIAKKFDDIISREVPDVKRAVKWSAPFYGIEGHGWFASFGAFKEHVKLNFFKGAALNPIPPSGGGKEMRSLDVRKDDWFDEQQIRDWVKQAVKIPGWGS